MQAQHPPLPAEPRWMSAIQAKGFKLHTPSTGNTTISTQKFGLVTLSKGEETILFFGRVVSCPRCRTVSASCSFCFIPWAVFGSAATMRIWAKYGVFLTYRAGLWHAGVAWKTDRDSAVQNCIGIPVHKKISTNGYGMPRFGHF